VTDHRQAFREQHFDPKSSMATIWLQEERLRQKMRSEIFPDLPESAFPQTPLCWLIFFNSEAVIFACFSQASSLVVGVSDILIAL
jgi:hypothetical protein